MEVDTTARSDVLGFVLIYTKTTKGQPSLKDTGRV